MTSKLALHGNNYEQAIAKLESDAMLDQGTVAYHIGQVEHELGRIQRHGKDGEALRAYCWDLQYHIDELIKEAERAIEARSDLEYEIELHEESLANTEG